MRAIMDNRKGRLWAGALPVLLASMACGAHAQVGELLFSTPFNDLAELETAGLVRASDRGLRLLGGWRLDGQVTLPAINVEGYRNLKLTYDRSVHGLDRGEAGVAAYSVNGSEFTPIERVEQGGGEVTLDLEDLPDDAT